jgi:uncharacterized protein
MIKSFQIANFRSVYQPLRLDMNRSNRKLSELPNYFKVGSHELASTAVVYGANASGKSNVLRALSTLKFMVLNSASIGPVEKIGSYNPFRLKEDAHSLPSRFELDFIVQDTRYSYKLAFSQQKIEYEQLLFYPLGKEALLFERVAGQEMRFGEYFKGEKKIIEKLTLPSQLFLSKAAQNNAESCLPVYQYFDSGVNVFTFLNQMVETDLERVYVQKLVSDPASIFSRRLNALISAFDTGIESLRVKDIAENIVFPESIPEKVQLKMRESMRYRIKATHAFYNSANERLGEVDFDLHDESVGTRSLLALAGIILDALENGTVLVVDEFEKNLHPIITSYLVVLFNNPLTNPKQAQLIFATHDITQLNDELFNRDQIWFTEKNEFGETDLIRCSDIKGLRLQAPLDKWYISGRLGGTAIINDADFLRTFQGDDAE